MSFEIFALPGGIRLSKIRLCYVIHRRNQKMRCLHETFTNHVESQRYTSDITLRLSANRVGKPTDEHLY